MPKRSTEKEIIEAMESTDCCEACGTVILNKHKSTIAIERDGGTSQVVEICCPSCGDVWHEEKPTG